MIQKFFDTTISSLAQLNEKVQRLARDGAYRAIAIGSGSAVVPLIEECDIVCSDTKVSAGVIPA